MMRGRAPSFNVTSKAGKLLGLSLRRRKPSLTKAGDKDQDNIDNSIGVLVKLNRAENLPAADSNGKSDPYVWIFVGKKKVSRSSVVYKTLSPTWQEEFFLPLNGNFNETIRIVVYDWDRMKMNDYLGELSLNLATVFGNQINGSGNKGKKEEGKEMNEGSVLDKLEVEAEKDDGKMDLGESLNGESEIFFEEKIFNVKKKEPEPAGTIFFSLQKCTKNEARQLARPKPKWEVKPGDSVAKQLIVDLVRGQNLAIKDVNGKSDPFCKIYFQGRKHKSKTIRYTLNPEWKERFDFPYDSSIADDKLRIDIFDKDMFSKSEFMGSCEVSIAELIERNGMGLGVETWLPVLIKGQKYGDVMLYISVIDVLNDHSLTPKQKAMYPASFKIHLVQAIKPKSSWRKTVTYAEVQVGETKLRTQPVEDSRFPTFERTIELPVKDIFAALEVSLFEKNRDNWEDAPNLVGKLVMPLLYFQNSSTDWYILKNADLTKTVDAQIRFATNFDYNIFSYMKLLSRRQENPLQKKSKFAIPKLRQEIKRVLHYKRLYQSMFRTIFNLLKWEFGFANTVIAMFTWALFCLLYKSWFVPALLLLGLLYTKYDVHLYNGRPFRINEDGDVIQDAITSGTSKDDDFFGNSKDDEESDDDEDVAVDDQATNGGNASANTSGNPPAGKSFDSDDGEDKKAPQKTFLEKVGLPWKMLLQLQHNAEKLANLCERGIGLCIWSNDKLTFVLASALLVLTFVLMLVPFNIVMLVAVEWQFIRNGLRKYGYAFERPPHYVPFNLAFDILSRVPTESEKHKYAIVQPDADVAAMLERQNIALRKDLSRFYR